ncbi:hypothetical protein COCSADRAFT_263014 [Bipolaris sorokiniana ND90Pr]|uniref:Uncharacterized protein n=1 Tax=Cochliobolus sativus (strain ND90Pr / ATCC 201652) TaxID=665912 RepID=M2SPI9_COCSN|nr:uncharacterized protein COCSADRAFT_263014 [Bipolaris sorokiniana ND90Pr]EMD59051.1 hypothetical protein COCSADRAFT_263014 [Bipolaris sorokiniana ND90Pr]
MFRPSPPPPKGASVLPRAAPSQSLNGGCAGVRPRMRLKAGRLMLASLDTATLSKAISHPQSMVHCTLPPPTSSYRGRKSRSNDNFSSPAVDTQHRAQVPTIQHKKADTSQQQLAMTPSSTPQN